MTLAPTLVAGGGLAWSAKLSPRSKSKSDDTLYLSPTFISSPDPLWRDDPHLWHPAAARPRRARGAVCQGRTQESERRSRNHPKIWSRQAHLGAVCGLDGQGRAG